MWIYATGMPKSLNIGKAMKKKAHKAGRVSLTGQFWEGHGTHLKPAYEPIIIARIPRGNMGFADLAEAYQTGALNIDAARIPTAEKWYQSDTPITSGNNYIGKHENRGFASESHEGGRFPSNVVFSHREGCSDSQCAPGCPVGELNKQSDYSESQPSNGLRSGSRSMDFKHKAGTPLTSYTDAGGAGRFFYTGKAASWERHLPDYLQPSEDLSSSARQKLLEDMQQIEPQFGTKDIFPTRWVPKRLRGLMQPARTTHPTVKPLDVTTYLAKLLLPPPSNVSRKAASFVAPPLRLDLSIKRANLVRSDFVAPPGGKLGTVGGG